MSGLSPIINRVLQIITAAPGLTVAQIAERAGVTAGVLVDTARVEVDYLKATGQDVSNFIDGLKAPSAAPGVTVNSGAWPPKVGRGA